MLMVHHYGARLYTVHYAKENGYLKIVLAFEEQLEENLGSNISSIFLQNNLLQETGAFSWSTPKEF